VFALENGEALDPEDVSRYWRLIAGLVFAPGAQAAHSMLGSTLRRSV
jgi:hypothetical protein